MHCKERIKISTKHTHFNQDIPADAPQKKNSTFLDTLDKPEAL
jgi:hypothetical protein